MRLFENARYPFLEWRRRAYIISGLMLAIGIGAMIFNVATIGSWLKYGVDFTGGTVAQVQFNKPVTAEELRGVQKGWEIASIGEPDRHEYVIRLPSFNENIGQDPTTELSNALTARFGADAYSVVRTEAVGPKVGSELQTRALVAILISFCATLVYLAFRFEWRFGVAAIVATAHDIIITLGLLALLRSEVSTGTVAAFLTIVGYSLNDTIIVFDRIREELAKRIRGEEYVRLLDRAINETLPRTVLTSGTTLATLTALYLFGGEVIRTFAQVLILGIGIGTFSSIFVASPALYFIETKWPPKGKNPNRSASGSSQRTAVA